MQNTFTAGSTQQLMYSTFYDQRAFPEDALALSNLDLSPDPMPIIEPLASCMPPPICKRALSPYPRSLMCNSHQWPQQNRMMSSAWQRPDAGTALPLFGGNDERPDEEDEEDCTERWAMLITVPPGSWQGCDKRRRCARELIRTCGLLEGRIKVVLGKLPRDIYFFGLDKEEVSVIERFLGSQSNVFRCFAFTASGPPGLKVKPRIMASIAEYLGSKKTEASFEELKPSLRQSLTADMPLDYDQFVEVDRPGFHGIMVKQPAIRDVMEDLPDKHLLVAISLRKLSLLIHDILQKAQACYEGSFNSNVHSHRDILPPAEGKNNVACHLDREFLKNVLELIGKYFPEDDAEKAARRKKIPFVVGEGEKKPLEHLIACVPGIEVVWQDKRKFIRKLELNKVDDCRESTRRIAASDSSSGDSRECASIRKTLAMKTNRRDRKEDRNQNEQKITKILSNILKEPRNQYMRLDALARVYREYSGNLEIPNGLRTFVIEHVKHFQILGEMPDEVVTLSHRAQIKRICNDITRLLRRSNPKSISSAELPELLVDLWQFNRESEVLDVSQFGVCFLDDLLVTIPQHWGVHCSTYVSSSNGKLVSRQYGDGEEDVPSFIELDHRIRPPASPLKANVVQGICKDCPDATNCNWDLEGYGVVHVWMPLHLRTPFQQKQSAFIMQQILNMYRGDPTAADAVKFVEVMLQLHGGESLDLGGRSNLVDVLKRLESHCSRANVESELVQKSRRSDGVRDSPTKHHVPLDFKIGFNQFIPTFHHVSNAQAAVENYGAKTLFELFDNMADTFILTHHEANHAEICLTAEARRDVLERRLSYLLQRENRSLPFEELLKLYCNEPTMAPFYDESEIERAARHCNLFQICNGPGKCFMISIKPTFSLRRAIALYGMDIKNVLSIFMTSFTPLTMNRLRLLFESRFGRVLPSDIVQVLLDRGALRSTKITSTSAAATTLDLQGFCRTVRNLIYQMTDEPSAIYRIPSEAADRRRLQQTNRSEESRYSLHQLLEFSGDCTVPYFDVENLMQDFEAFFEQVRGDGNARGYRLRPEVIAGEPSTAEKEKLNKKKDKKGGSRQPSNQAASRPSPPPRPVQPNASVFGGERGTQFGGPWVRHCGGISTL